MSYQKCHHKVDVTKFLFTKEEFCRFSNHFNNHWLPGRPLVILDGHHNHLDSSVFDVAEDLGIQLLCLPVYCSRKLQPLDKSSFKSLKSYWNETIGSCRRQHPGRPLGILQFPELFTQAWMRAATPSNVLSDFRSSGMYPYNPNIILSTAFSPSNVSDRSVEQVPSIPVLNNPQKDADTSPVSLFRQSGKISAPSLSVYEFLPTPKITRSRRSLNEKDTLVSLCLFPPDGKTVSSV
jgi:hypothetical protein